MKKQIKEQQYFNAPIQGLDDRKHRGRWLIIEASTGEIMVHKKTLHAAQKEAERMGVKHPAILKMPSFGPHDVVMR